MLDRAGNVRTRGWPLGAVRGTARLHMLRIAPPPTRIRRKIREPCCSPNTDRIAHPPVRRSLTEGWTRDAFDGTLSHGRRVLRCARHEGSGLITRAFTFSDAAFYVVTARDGHDDAR